MNKADPPLADDELIRRIRDAFDQQATPACPIKDDGCRPAKRESAAPMRPPLFPIRGHGEHWMASLTLMTAMIAIAIVVFKANVDPPQVELSRDEIIDAIDPVDVESIDLVAQQGELDEESAATVISQNPKPASETTEVAEQPPAPSSPALLNVIDAANDFLARRNAKPDLLIEQLNTHYALDRATLQSAFRAIGVPAGVSSVRSGVDSGRSWVRGKDQVAFTYGFEYPQILDDLTRLINACYEDEIVESVLDGIRDDVHGPKIDLRNDFFPLLQNEVILVVSTRSKPLEDSLTIVLPVKDATTMWRLVNQAHRINMDSTSETHRNVEMRVVATTEGKRKAWCIIENHLIIGDLKEVQATIDRFNGE